MKLLIVENEVKLRRQLRDFFSQHHYIVEEACGYAAAEEKIRNFNYDCIVMNTVMHDGNGLELVRKLRNEGKEMGIVIISELDATEDKISGLYSGADDYLVKPFELVELSARIHAVLRRKNFNRRNEFDYNEIHVWLNERRVQVSGREVVLTRKEFDMLIYFMINRGRVLSKERMVEHLWADEASVNADTFDFIYTHIRNLRTKLLEAGAEDYIQTVYGVGYKLSDGCGRA